MKKLVIALLVIGAIGGSVFAGEMKKDGSVMLGYGIAGGTLGDIVGGGIAFGFGYEGYKINDMFSVGGEFMYTSGSDDYDPANLGAANASDYSISTWGLIPYIKYSKEVDFGGSKADIYGLFGLGIYGVSSETEGGGYVNNSASDSEVGFNLGGGIMFPMGDKMKIGGDLRYHLVASNLSYFVPAVKFTYSF